MQETPSIAFIGLGKMGSGICANIQRAQYPLTVYNRTRSKTKRFENNGATVADSARMAVQHADIIFTSLMDDASVLDICLDKDGILAGLQPDSIHIGLTTIQPATANKLAELHKAQQCQYIAAPVVGRPDAAEAGSLFTFLGGDADAIKTARTAIDCYSEVSIPVSDTPGKANAMKVCVNYMGMAQLLLLGDIFAFADKSGLDKETIFKMTRVLYGGSGPMVDYAEKIKNRTFDNAGFELSAGLKDALLFEKTFDEAGVSTSTISSAKANLMAAVANGLGRKDWSAMTEITRLKAGLDNQIDQ